MVVAESTVGRHTEYSTIWSQLFWANAIQNSPPWGSSISLNNVNFSKLWATYLEEIRSLWQVPK